MLSYDTLPTCTSACNDGAEPIDDAVVWQRFIDGNVLTNGPTQIVVVAMYIYLWGEETIPRAVDRRVVRAAGELLEEYSFQNFTVDYETCCTDPACASRALIVALKRYYATYPS